MAVTKRAAFSPVTWVPSQANTDAAMCPGRETVTTGGALTMDLNFTEKFAFR